MTEQQPPLSTPRRWLRRLKRAVLAVVALVLVSTVGVWLFFEFRPPPKTLRVLPSVSLPGHGALAFADYPTLDGDLLYVGYSSRDRLVVIDTRKGEVVASVDGLNDVHGCAVDRADNLAFTSNGGDDTVGIIDLRTHSLVARVPGGKGPDAIIFDARDRLVYAADGRGRTATLIDPATRTVVATIPLGGKPEFPVADPSTGLVYQNLEDSNEVVVVDPLRRLVTARYPIGPGRKPTGIALDAAGHRLFVACGNKTLVVLDEDDGRVVASAPIGAGVDGVVYDPASKRVYTANFAATVTVIQADGPDTYRVLEDAPAPLGSHALAVDLVTHRLYVVCAGLGTARVAVFEPKN